MAAAAGPGDDRPMSANPTPPAPTAAAPVRPARITLTRAGERELRAKRDALRRHIDVELPRRLRGAREFGEASGNDDYLQIIEEEAVSNARLQALEQILAVAEVVDGDGSGAGLAAIGSIVTIRLGEELVERRIVGDYEAIGADAVSASSPIGSAIIGRGAGETATVELPNGTVRDLEVVAVRVDAGDERLAA
jgi:transcription elongation factor GreA